ncbi:MAG: Na+/H+ antiporter NhaC family protein, partial [Planctomycetota bacterium]
GGLGERMRQVLGASSSTLALQYGALAGLAVALLMTTVQRLLPAAETRQALVRGVLTVLPAIAILWFAAAMSRMTGNNPSPADAGDPAPATAAADDADEFPYASHRLYTAEFLSEQILGPDTTEPTALVRTALPTGVFLLSAVVAFCTGTSFGTMGLVVPIVVPLAASAAGGTADALATPLVLASLGGVLSGAIFGDHCSPISDTTILSSQACACDHMAHVRTQLPYALVIAAVCVVLGTVPIGLGISVWLLLPLQTAALIALLIVLGRRVDDGKTLA